MYPMVEIMIGAGKIGAYLAGQSESNELAKKPSWGAKKTTETKKDVY